MKTKRPRREGAPWFGHHEDRTPTHGYEPTREAAMGRSPRPGGGNRPALPLAWPPDANSPSGLAPGLAEGHQNACTAFLGVTPVVTPRLETEHRHAPIAE
jgi:hypothetical protein